MLPNHPGQICGTFLFPSPLGSWLTVVSHDGLRNDSFNPKAETGWEHVYVVASERRTDGDDCNWYSKDRCPTWGEMCLVKDLFWAPHERVVLYHPPLNEYINNYEFSLHLWKWRDGAFPHPSIYLVAEPVDRPSNFRSWEEQEQQIVSYLQKSSAA